MKISIITGSHRSPSQSDKVGHYIESRLKQNFDSDTWLYSLAGNPLPLWDQAIWENSDEWNERLAPLKKELSESDGLVIVCPEWHGQVPSGLKNFFLMFNRFDLGHKPALIVSISSGDGGAYPVAELRMSSYKNNRLCYIPEQLIIRHVEQVLNANDEDNDANSQQYFSERIDWSLDILKAYAIALKEVRKLPGIHHDKFTNGM